MFGRKSARTGLPKLTASEKLQVAKLERLIELATSSQSAVRECVRLLRKRLQTKDARHALLALRLTDRIVTEIEDARVEAASGPGGKKFCEAVMRLALDSKEERMRAEARANLRKWADEYAGEATRFPYFATSKVELEATVAREASNVAGHVPLQPAVKREPPEEPSGIEEPWSPTEEPWSPVEGGGAGENDSMVIQVQTMIEMLESVASAADAETLSDVKTQCVQTLQSVRNRISELASEEPPREQLIQSLISASDGLSAKLDSLQHRQRKTTSSMEFSNASQLQDPQQSHALNDLFDFEASKPTSAPGAVADDAALSGMAMHPSSPFDSMLMRRKQQGGRVSDTGYLANGEALFSTGKTAAPHDSFSADSLQGVFGAPKGPSTTGGSHPEQSFSQFQQPSLPPTTEDFDAATDGVDKSDPAVEATVQPAANTAIIPGSTPLTLSSAMTQSAIDDPFSEIEIQPPSKPPESAMLQPFGAEVLPPSASAPPLLESGVPREGATPNPTAQLFYAAVAPPPGGAMYTPAAPPAFDSSPPQPSVVPDQQPRGLFPSDPAQPTLQAEPQEQDPFAAAASQPNVTRGISTQGPFDSDPPQPRIEPESTAQVGELLFASVPATPSSIAEGSLQAGIVSTPTQLNSMPEPASQLPFASTPSQPSVNADPHGQVPFSPAHLQPHVSRVGSSQISSDPPPPRVALESTAHTQVTQLPFPPIPAKSSSTAEDPPQTGIESTRTQPSIAPEPTSQLPFASIPSQPSVKPNLPGQVPLSEAPVDRVKCESAMQDPSASIPQQLSIMPEPSAQDASDTIGAQQSSVPESIPPGTFALTATQPSVKPEPGAQGPFDSISTELDQKPESEAQYHVQSIPPEPSSKSEAVFHGHFSSETTMPDNTPEPVVENPFGSAPPQPSLVPGTATGSGWPFSAVPSQPSVMLEPTGQDPFDVASPGHSEKLESGAQGAVVAATPKMSTSPEPTMQGAFGADRYASSAAPETTTQAPFSSAPMQPSVKSDDVVQQRSDPIPAGPLSVPESATQDSFASIPAQPSATLESVRGPFASVPPDPILAVPATQGIPDSVTPANNSLNGEAVTQDPFGSSPPQPFVLPEPAAENSKAPIASQQQVTAESSTDGTIAPFPTQSSLMLDSVEHETFGAAPTQPRVISEPMQNPFGSSPPDPSLTQEPDAQGPVESIPAQVRNSREESTQSSSQDPFAALPAHQGVPKSTPQESLAAMAVQSSGTPGDKSQGLFVSASPEADVRSDLATLGSFGPELSQSGSLPESKTQDSFASFYPEPRMPEPEALESLDSTTTLPSVNSESGSQVPFTSTPPQPNVTSESGQQQKPPSAAGQPPTHLPNPKMREPFPSIPAQPSIMSNLESASVATPAQPGGLIATGTQGHFASSSQPVNVTAESAKPEPIASISTHSSGMLKSVAQDPFAFIPAESSVEPKQFSQFISSERNATLVGQGHKEQALVSLENQSGTLASEPIRDEQPLPPSIQQPTSAPISSTQLATSSQSTAMPEPVNTTNTFALQPTSALQLGQMGSDVVRQAPPGKPAAEASITDQMTSKQGPNARQSSMPRGFSEFDTGMFPPPQAPTALANAFLPMNTHSTFGETATITPQVEASVATPGVDSRQAPDASSAFGQNFAQAKSSNQEDPFAEIADQPTPAYGYRRAQPPPPPPPASVQSVPVEGFVTVAPAAPASSQAPVNDLFSDLKWN